MFIFSSLDLLRSLSVFVFPTFWVHFFCSACFACPFFIAFCFVLSIHVYTCVKMWLWKRSYFRIVVFFFLLFFRHEWLEFKPAVWKRSLIQCTVIRHMSVILIFNTRFFVHLCWQSAHNCGRFIFPDLFCRRNKSLWFLFHHKSWDKLESRSKCWDFFSLSVLWPWLDCRRRI